MNVLIRVKDSNGKWCKAWPSDFCVAAFQSIVDQCDWEFLVRWLCKFCLKQAEQEAPGSKADMWIERYRKVAACLK